MAKMKVKINFRKIKMRQKYGVIHDHYDIDIDGDPRGEADRYMNHPGDDAAWWEVSIYLGSGKGDEKFEFPHDTRKMKKEVIKIIQDMIESGEMSLYI